MADEQPLIWTAKGNLPIDSLEYRYYWDDQEGYTKFVEQYWLDGELVKESAHVYSRVGLPVEGVAGL